MRKSNRYQPHSLPFRLLLVLAGASLLLATVPPRANAGSADYWNFEEPHGVVINQPLASNYNPNMAVASGAQPGGSWPLVPDALFSWTGGTNTTWSTGTNWSPAGPPGAADTAQFNSAFTNQPNLTASTSVGSLLMTAGVAQNVTISDSGAFVLTINGVAGIGIQIDNTVGARTLTISSGLALGGSQAWTNNSANLFTVSGNMALGANALTVNGTGNTTISGIISGIAGGSLTKADGGTLTLTGNNAYAGGTIVNGGTLLVNGASDLGTGTVMVNSGTTLGGNSTATFNSGRITVAAGGNFSPGNGGNTIGNITVGPLTLSAGSNFRVDLNGTGQGTTYDFVTGAGSGATGLAIAGSNLVVHVGFSVSVGQTFTIIHNGGGFGGQTFAQGTIVQGDNGNTFSITYNGDNIILTVVSLVPEPSTYIGGALAIAGLAFTQRRRLRKLIAFSR